MLCAKAVALAATLYLSIAIGAMRLKLHDTRAAVKRLKRGPTFTDGAPRMAPRSQWSAREDKQLKSLVAEYGPKSWVTIAAHLLESDKNAKQCRERWVHQLHPQLNKGEWTPEEDEEILKQVGEIGLQWVQISKQHMPSRAARDIRHRWDWLRKPIRKNVRTVRTRRPWTAEEDELLTILVLANGSKGWAWIATRFQDRSDRVCWGRWHRHLQPRLNKAKWTEEEDQQIWDRVAEMGLQWTQMSMQYMPHRGPSDIWHRWQLLVQRGDRPKLSVEQPASSSYSNSVSLLQLPAASLPAPSAPPDWRAAGALAPLDRDMSPGLLLRLMAEQLPWSAEEDEQLKHLVAVDGCEDWVTIASDMRDRNPLQCWQRWHSHLQPHLETLEWKLEDVLESFDKALREDLVDRP